MHLENNLHDFSFDAFKRGDTRALQVIFRKFYPPLCLFAERMLQDRQAAEDLAGDTMLKLWNRHTDFENMQNVKAFLYITTRNACLNLLKQMQRESLSKKQFAYVSGHQEGFILNEIVRAEVMREIYEEIDKLPAQCQRIFKMSYFEGRNNHEIAEILELSIHTIKNQKARAIQLLRTRLPDLNMVTLMLLFSGVYHDI
jgi:RNA polymerase sigma-70 factor (family 1)